MGALCVVGCRSTRGQVLPDEHRTVRGSGVSIGPEGPYSGTTTVINGLRDVAKVSIGPEGPCSGTRRGWRLQQCLRVSIGPGLNRPRRAVLRNKCGRAGIAACGRCGSQSAPKGRAPEPRASCVGGVRVYVSIGPEGPCSGTRSRRHPGGSNPVRSQSAPKGRAPERKDSTSLTNRFVSIGPEGPCSGTYGYPYRSTQLGKSQSAPKGRAPEQPHQKLVVLERRVSIGPEGPCSGTLGWRMQVRLNSWNSLLVSIGPEGPCSGTRCYYRCGRRVGRRCLNRPRRAVLRNTVIRISTFEGDGLNRPRRDVLRNKM